MVSEVFAGLSAFKTMLDTAKGLKDINDASGRNAVAIELQEHILTAQAAQMALVERVRELEEEVAGFEAWETEKQRYKLTKCAYSSALVYLLKKSEANGEPGHALCTNCYERRTKSILQWNGEVIISSHFWVCPSCGAKVSTHGEDLPEFADA